MPLQCIDQTPSARPARRIYLPLLLALACLLLPACRRRSAAKNEPASRTESQIESPGSVAPVAVDSRVQPPPPPTEPSAAVAGRLDLNEVNLRIRDFRENNGRMPRSIEELVATKYLPVMPPVPPGKQLVLGPDKEHAILINH